jgi:phytoene dehydrogenase-like protein
VETILVQQGAATGVRLSDGEPIAADWVISAADGHATIYEMLAGRYVGKTTERAYATLRPFPSYVQVSLGVARDLSDRAGHLLRVLDTPLTLDPETRLHDVQLRLFHFDPTFAPPGKTAVTCFLPTRNVAFWTDLQRQDQALYQAEKQRVAEAVIAILDRMVPGIRAAIEEIDVATPATVMRYTGNWQGSMEGWLLAPGWGARPLPKTLPGLRRFMMVGHWVSPGGGLPSGVMTARAAVQALCKQDRVPFAPAR